MIILGPVIGHVSSNMVNILFEVDTDECVTIRLYRDGVFIVMMNIQAVGGRPTIIQAQVPQEIGYEPWQLTLICKDQARHGSFSRGSIISFISCNNYALGGPTVWRRLRTRIPNVAIHMGDNICLDNGNSYLDLAILGARAKGYDGALEAIRGAYRIHWSKDDVAYILANCSNIMIWDDHDVCDSWDQDLKLPSGWIDLVNTGGYRSLAMKIIETMNGDRRWRIMAMIAAMEAYCEYQAPLAHGTSIIPGSWTMELGLPGRKVLFVDRRMHRAGDRPLIPEMSFTPDIIIATVPPFYLGPMITNKVIESLMRRIFRIRDLYDHWLLDHEDLDQILDLAKDGTIIASGDVHMCLLSRINLENGGISRTVTQITSSAISSPPVPKIVDLLLSLRSWSFKTRHHRGHVNHLFKTRHNGCYILDSRSGEIPGIDGFILA